jgi:DNA-directed RNA polymerase specialized sigma24 family protein
MKNISTQVKVNVIKLFLQGFSYDEIAMQTGIGKGTVASIVDDSGSRAG